MFPARISLVLTLFLLKFLPNETANVSCTSHVECNPSLLENIYETIKKQTKIFCIQSKCQCQPATFLYDITTRECRRKCSTNSDCKTSEHASSSHSMICESSENFCKCPNGTFEYKQMCTKPNTDTQFTSTTQFILNAFTIILILTIMIYPLIQMLQKHRHYIFIHQNASVNC